MADLDDPSPCFLTGMALLGFLFLRATGHMSNVAVTFDDLQRWLATVSGIQAQMFGTTISGHLALDHDARQNGVELRDIMPVRPGHDERQGDTTAVDQQVTLAPIFFPDQSGWARPALAPVGP